MMRFASRTRPQAAVLTVATLLLLSGAASADELLVPKEPKRRLAAQIIADIDKPGETPRRESWFRTHLNVRKGAGIEYRHSLTVGERELEVSVYGPLTRKRPGVGFEVRF